MTNEEMQNKILELEARLNALNDYSSIPLDVGNAIKARIIPSGYISGRSTAGTPSTVTIVESGVATVIAQAPLTGKIALTIDNVEYIIPTI